MIASTISHLFPGISFMSDCIIVDDGTGPKIIEWNRPEQQPTPEELEAARPAAEAAAARAAMPSLTPAQLDLALLHFGLLDAVEACVAAADRETQIAYKKVKTFKRSNRLLNTAAGLLEMTDEQVDAVWMYGATLEPGE